MMINNNNRGGGDVQADGNGDAVETDPSGRYARFDQLLGKGAIKKVYKAVDQLLGIEVAWNQVKLNHLIKTPNEVQRLYSEVHLLSTLQHDSLIHFHTSWIDSQLRTFNFITEMFTSGTLRQYRKKYKRIDIRAIKSWASQILRGLVYLHSHEPPVIHRDLKCDNIFVNGHLGQVKIGDLGLATILRSSRTAHSVIGTPEFMAPELYEEEYNELVDVYSFGMCVLEMLTSEFPYNECANPAQIYKKVTSGKLPAAFYRIQDQEAQNFVGKCLQLASKRPPAKDLLLDPFLLPERAMLQPTRQLEQSQPSLTDTEIEKLRIVDDPPRTMMIITGKLNPEDDTIFLRVQISEKQGTSRNIYFPFDTVSDTPLGVATEMIKELEITDMELNEISDMIKGEISSLLPHWNNWDQLGPNNADYQEVNENLLHFDSDSSCSSLQASFSDDLFNDTSSQSSSYSGFYGSVMEPAVQQLAANSYASTRFCQERSFQTHQSVVGGCYEKCKLLMGVKGPSISVEKQTADSKRLTRNRSLVDVRSQLLHWSLTEEVYRRRLSKTVGAVETIGFRDPFGVVQSSAKVNTRKDSTRKNSSKGRA
uniref:non-specific serine/threonine protein kinase n=1 Tax=Kalanchoe fedtschenkoi TaxID=63787 RepID=A0A7N0VK67_KALFE